MNRNLLNFLKDIKEDEPVSDNRHSRVILCDAMNLFFRNFSMLNSVTPNGVHIGGLGGFLRSLGVLIREIQPTSVYIVFDGEGSTINRKNILPEYKSDRGIRRITNWDIFDNLEEEGEAKVDQISRLIQYLKLLPVKTIVIDKTEADDLIAYLAKYMSERYDSKIYIVSNDQDYLQLVNNNVVVYRPTERLYYDRQKIIDKFQVLPSNFILYKTLLGDQSDSVGGIKGLGKGKIFKLFPELLDIPLTLEHIFNMCEEKMKEHVVYARILQDFGQIERNYKIMDLENPLIDDTGKEILNELVEDQAPHLQPKLIAKLYNEDSLIGIIRNLDIWIKDNFNQLEAYNK